MYVSVEGRNEKKGANASITVLNFEEVLILST